MAGSKSDAECRLYLKKIAQYVVWNKDDTDMQKQDNLTEFLLNFNNPKLQTAVDEFYDSGNFYFNDSVKDYLLKNRYLDLYITIVCEEISFLEANERFGYDPVDNDDSFADFIDQNIEELKEKIVLENPPGSPEPSKKKKQKNKAALKTISTFCVPDFQKFARWVAWNGNVTDLHEDKDLTEFWNHANKPENPHPIIKTAVDGSHDAHFNDRETDYLLKNRYLDLYIDIVCEHRSFLTANLMFQYNPVNGTFADFITHKLEMLKNSVVLETIPGSLEPGKQEKPTTKQNKEKSPGTSSVRPRRATAAQPMSFPISNYVKRTATGVNKNKNVAGTKVKLVQTVSDGDCLFDSICQAYPVLPDLPHNKARIAGLRRLVVEKMKSETVDDEIFKNTFDIVKAMGGSYGFLGCAAEVNESTTLEEFKDATIQKFAKNRKMYADAISVSYLKLVLTDIDPDLQLEFCSGKIPPEADEMESHPKTIYVTNEQYFTGQDPDGATPHYMVFILTLF